MSSKNTQKEKRQVQERPELVEELRSEVNLLLQPFFALTTREISTRLKTEFRKEVKRDGEKLEVVWKVMSNPEYGYPGPFDKKVHRVIEQIIEEQDFPVSNPIQFSIYSLCKRLDISTGGSNYRKIKETLERLITTSIKSKGTFYRKGKKRWIDKTFHLYDGLIYKGEELEDGAIAETNYLFLNDIYLESINERYVKPLDFQYYESLDTNVAKRLYELLGVKFFGIHKTDHNYIRYKYTTLCDLLPLSRHRYPSDVKRQLEPAHEELQKGKFLSSVNWKKVGNEKDWYISYFPGRKAKEEIKRFDSMKDPNEPEQEGLLKPVEKYESFSSLNKDEDEVERLVERMIETLGKGEQNDKFYYKIARHCPKNVINMALKDTEAADRSGEIQKSKPAFFGYWIQELCQRKGIELGIESNFDFSFDYSDSPKEVKGEEESREVENKDMNRDQTKENNKQQEKVEESIEQWEKESQSVGKYEEARLMEYYRNLSQEKQEEIDNEAMEKLGSFTKGRAKSLRRKGKDPLEESITVRADFEDNRLTILEDILEGQ